MDYKEYSRLRSIARKRIERASAAGATQYTFIPTVAQVKASGNPEQYFNLVKEFLDVPTLREARKASVIKDRPVIPELKLPPAPAAQKRTPEQQKARKREQSRRSKAKRAVERAAINEKEARKQVGYLKALEKVAANWRKSGVDMGHWLGVLSPKKAKAFVDYMEYRFSQGDYKSRYVIDTFIKDFGTLVQKGYDFKDIEQDFGSFLDQQKKLTKNKRKTNRFGITSEQVDAAWSKFVDKFTDR